MLRQGRFAEAEAPLRDALCAEPDSAALHDALGALLATLGRRAEAEPLLRASIRLQPESAGAHANLGNLLRELGRLDEAERSLRRALRLAPGHLGTLNNLGAALRDAGRPAEAEPLFREAVRLRPGFAEAWHNLGALLRQRGAALPAAECFGAAVRARPELRDAWLSLAASLREAGRAAEAEGALRAALRRWPDQPSLLAELGRALLPLGRPEDAESVLDAALRGRPDDEDARLAAGVAAHEAGGFGRAERRLRAVLDRRPDDADARSALGNLLRDLGRPAEAEAALRAALRLRPDFPEARVHLGFALLQAGRYEEGWREHEHRLRAAPWKHRLRRFAAPEWDGGPVEGRTVLLHAEQGLGDAIQFSRYAPMLAARGARVLLESPEPLRRLFATLPGVAVLPRGDGPPPAHDLHCPLMGLPHRLGSGGAPGPVPYLRAEASVVSAWRERLRRLPPGPRVGLTWAGDPRMAADRRRSLPAGALAPLSGTARFVSLQKGPAPPPGLALLDPTAELADFADTAALVQALDLVIAVDTAVLHLAGALGRPVWLLNRADSCWRWPEGDGAPWYPTLRQFRQPAHGDWAPVIAAVRAALLDPDAARA